MSSASPQSAAGLPGATGRALGTSTHVVVTLPDRLAAARAAVADVTGAVDAACSRFREDSELMLLQARGGVAARRVSPLLYSALQQALRAAVISDGAVDPTIGTAIRVLGYDRDFASVAADGPPLTVVVSETPGWRGVRLDPSTSSALVPAGVEFDLGATAKAYAADLAAAAALEAAGGGGVLVNLGGDIAVAGEPPEGGWVVQIAEASDAQPLPGADSVAILAGGMATSSTMVRRWRRGQVTMHHIVDPATGMPATGPWRTVTCAAGSCLDANIASTTAIVRGSSAVDWLSKRSLPARLVDHQGAVRRVAGWP